MLATNKEEWTAIDAALKMYKTRLNQCLNRNPKDPKPLVERISTLMDLIHRHDYEGKKKGWLSWNK